MQQNKSPLAPREYADNKSGTSKDAQKLKDRDTKQPVKNPANVGRDDGSYAGNKRNGPHDQGREDLDEESLNVEYTDQPLRREGNPAVSSRDNQRDNQKEQKKSRD